MKAKSLWAVLLVAAFVVAFATGSSIAFKLGYGLLAVPLFGAVAVALTGRGITAEVQRITSYLQVGEFVEESITLQSLHWWPKLLLEVRHASSPFSGAGRVVSLWPYQTLNWITKTRASRRGIYEYGRVDVVVRDPFGLFERRVRRGTPQRALVYPATVDLPGFHVPTGSGWTEGVVVAGKTFVPSPIASTVRDLAPGDTARRIHWPSTLKRGKLMVKEFEREPAGPSDAIWVLLDLWAGSQAGQGIESTVEYGVTIAASVARRFIETGRTVGLIVGGQERSVLRADSGPAQLGRVLQTLALAQPGDEFTLARSLDIMAETAQPKTTAIIVSAAQVSEIASAVAFLDTRGVTPVPIMLEAPSFDGEPPARGDMYRLPGTQVDAYVVHQGDEIQRRLDYRLAGHGGPDLERMTLGRAGGPLGRAGR